MVVSPSIHSDLVGSAFSIWPTKASLFKRDYVMPPGFEDYDSGDDKWVARLRSFSEQQEHEQAWVTNVSFHVLPID